MFPFYCILLDDIVSDAYSSFDMRVGIIVRKGEIAVIETENIFPVGVKQHLRQTLWGTCELQLYLLYMVKIDVRIAERMNKLAALQSCSLCHHLEQQGIRCDVERHSEEDIGTALVQLQA